MTNEMMELANKVEQEATSPGSMSHDDLAAVAAALRAQSDVRAPAPQGEPVAWRVKLLSGKYQMTQERDIADTWRANGAVVDPVYAGPLAYLAEDCAKIAEGHVGNCSAAGMFGQPCSCYDEACHDIAKAIRDAHIVEGAGK